MRRALLIGAMGMVTMLTGCAAPVHLSDGMRDRIFMPCTDDAFCFRNTYGIVRELNCNEFPVTFRNNEYEYRANRYEWIHQNSELVPVSPLVIYR